jgi:hypothetical protein
MKRLFLAISLLVGVAGAQTNINWMGYGDTLAISAFKADSLKFTSAYVWANNEQKAVSVQVSDTSIAGLGSDSVQFSYGYELGYPTLPFGSTTAVTRWCQATTIDSFRVMNGTKFVNPTTLAGVVQARDTTNHTYTPIDAWGYVDTSSSTTSSIQTHSLTVPWAPYIRFWAKGGTGNNKTKFLRVRVTVYQRMFQNTRGR